MVNKQQRLYFMYGKIISKCYNMNLCVKFNNYTERGENDVSTNFSCYNFHCHVCTHCNGSCGKAYCYVSVRFVDFGICFFDMHEQY